MDDKKKSLFNFYLDNDAKKKAMSKIERLMGKQEKGQLASLLRVLIRVFVETPDDKVSPTLLEAVDAEYEYTTTKNKRSRL